MTPKEFTFNIYETCFFGGFFNPEKPKATVVLVHGMGEHFLRYSNSVIPYLTNNEFAVVSFDHFGHGKTEGKRGYCPSYKAVLDSIGYAVKKAEKLNPNLPVFLYGHSMGANAVINYVLKRNHQVKGVVASSPFLKLAFKPPFWKVFVGKIMQKLAPSITMNSGLNPKHISRIPQEVEKYKNDPLIHNKISPNFSLPFINSGMWAIKNAELLKIPALLIHGTNDKITDYKGSEEFAEKTKLATLKLYKNGYHELHNDLCKKNALKDITFWLNKQLI